MKIVCFHLLNDFSGSPKVLASVLSLLIERGHSVELYTSGGGAGALDEVKEAKIHRYSYSFSQNPAVTMARYGWVQLITFFKAFRHAGESDTVFYINTLLPVGAALAGRLMGLRVVYHYHENAFVKGIFYRTLARAMEHLATRIVCVSVYQASFLKAGRKVTVVPNTLPEAFTAQLRPDAERALNSATVMMLSSLKGYKGTIEFISLARKLPEFKFLLIINDEAPEIDRYLHAHRALPLPENLELLPRQREVARHYNRVALVVNLSNPQQFIETFGLTALEAMAAGLPVIVPQVGGIAEMVEDGVNGYRLDVNHLDDIAARIKEVLTDRSLYLKLSQGALATAQQYNPKLQLDAICRELGEK